MFKTKTYLLSFCLLFFSQIGHAQIEKLTPDLINQYGLNFSTPDNEPFTLWVGTQFLIDEGYNVSVGALYLKDNNADTFELISKTLQDQPAIVTGRANPFIDNALFNIDATDDYETITYVSENPDIAPGDSGNNQDVFVFNRTTGLTTRVEGSQAHTGSIFGLKISGSGGHLAYLSTDKDFGIHPSLNGGGNAIYLYKIATEDLITLPHIVELSDPLDGDPLGLAEFTADGQNLFFYVDYASNDLGLGNAQLKLYNIASEAINLVYDAGAAGTLGLSSLTVISNSDYLFQVTDFIDGSDLEPGNTLMHYDLGENQIYELVSNTGLNTIAVKSANNRYVVLYQSFNIGFRSIDTQAGQLWMLDTRLNEIRPIFDIKKMARTHVIYDAFKSDCDIPYVLNAAFFQSDYFPCGENLSRNQFLSDNYVDPATQVNHQNTDSFNVQPEFIRLHNDARHISFEGNSWYIDDAVSFEDFSYKDNGYPDYLREFFVAVNPFLNDINISGTPSIDRSSETGLYIWQRPDGKVVVKATAGDPAQAGESTLFSGSLTSAATISNLTPFSVESDDSVTPNGDNEIVFELNAISPWEDRFIFDVDINASLCVDLTDFAGGLFIGPDKVQVTPPYDIGLLQSCEPYQINVEGRPSLDRFSDRGWFIWRQNNGQWRSEFIGYSLQNTSVPLVYEGNIASSSPLTNLVPISIENSDILNHTGAEIDFTLTVPYRWFDGFRFTSDPAAQTCVSLTAPADENIFIGVDKVPMPKSFDLNTLQSCDSAPMIETMGRPPVNRSTDNGIFVWENANRQWQAEVVSGDMPRTVPIAVVSQQALSNVGQINIESNDVFNIMQNALDLSLRVRSPWLDGFRFTDQAQSNTCISTTNSATPIYLGPNRVELGSSLNLDTLTNCQ